MANWSLDMHGASVELLERGGREHLIIVKRGMKDQRPHQQLTSG